MNSKSNKSPSKSKSRSKSKKTKRTKSKEKDTDKPTRPLNAFQLYAADLREENSKKGGDKLTFKDIGSKWKKLASSKKKVYQDKYEASKAEFDKEMEEYKKKKKNEDDDDESVSE